MLCFKHFGYATYCLPDTNIYIYRSIFGVWERLFKNCNTATTATLAMLFVFSCTFIPASRVHEIEMLCISVPLRLKAKTQRHRDFVLNTEDTKETDVSLVLRGGAILSSPLPISNRSNIECFVKTMYVRLD